MAPDCIYELAVLEVSRWQRQACEKPLTFWRGKMKARAEMVLRDGSVDFIVECKASTFKDAMSKLTQKVLFEFDHSFSADNWGSVSVTIVRDE